MHWASALSMKDDLAAAIAEAGGRLEAGLGGAAADLVVAFAGSELAGASELPRLLAARFGGAVILGCTGGGVIGGAREVETGAGLSLTAASLPGVRLTPFHVDAAELPPDGGSPQQWRERVGVDPAERPTFLLLGDPFTSDPDALVAGLDGAYPEATKIGGLASGGLSPGEHQLFVLGDAFASGAAGVALTGNVVVDAIVAQGCRPIGPPMSVTSCRHNRVLELDHRRPMEALCSLYSELPEEDQELFRSSLFVGFEYREGDYLIRNIIGVDPDSGAMAVAALPDQLQTVRFYLRDGHTAAEDLEARLRAYRPDGLPSGALLFSCIARGEHLFGLPDHDSKAFRQIVGDIPLGGFFCNGEIGPVGSQTFLHGYTSAFAVFRPAPTH